MNKIAPVFVLLAGVLWGSMGIFVNRLAEIGMSSLSITSVRLLLSGIMLVLFLMIFDRKRLIIRWKDLGWFAADGLFSIVGMSFLYFTSILKTSLSVAAILLYTAPVFVMLMSALFFKEKMTIQKIVSLVLAVGGSVLVAGVGGESDVIGILAGIGSGFCYALYSIFGVKLMVKYHPFAVTAYTFLLAGLFSTVFADPLRTIAVVKEAGGYGWFLSVCLAIVTATIPYLLYTWGLKYMEAGKASILATVEPMVASISGVLIYREAMTFLKGTGILLILIAVTVLSFPRRRKMNII